MAFLVIIAKGVHLFSFRTQQLSPSAPMVLPGYPGGRVGHGQVRHTLNKKSKKLLSHSFHCSKSVSNPTCYFSIIQRRPL